METTTSSSTSVKSSSRVRATIVAVGAAAGLTLAGLGIAAAQSNPTDPPPSDQPAKPKGERHAGGKRGMHGRHMGIHGEFVTRTPDGGGFQTMATQHGEVTEVSASSLTVKSEDGFTRTYVVNDDTLVNAGNEGIADVQKGDEVHVMAVVRDGKAHALHVRDATKAKAHRDRFGPAPSGEGGSS